MKFRKLKTGYGKTTAANASNYENCHLKLLQKTSFLNCAFERLVNHQTNFLTISYSSFLFFLFLFFLGGGAVAEGEGSQSS